MLFTQLRISKGPLLESWACIIMLTFAYPIRQEQRILALLVSFLNLVHKNKNLRQKLNSQMKKLGRVLFFVFVYFY